MLLHRQQIGNPGDPPSGRAKSLTKPAATGSVTAEKSSGRFNSVGALLSAWAQLWADGVAMATSRSAFSPIICWAICPAVPILAWALCTVYSAAIPFSWR